MSKVVTTKSRFELIDFSEEEKELAEKGGWRQDSKGKLFTHTPTLFTLTQLNNADLAAQQAYQQYQLAIAFSRASNISTEFKIPAPIGLNYLPFQSIGVAYASQREGTLIADAPGLGKTIQGCGLMNLDTSLHSILVICPEIIKIKWRDEIVKWFTRCESIGLAYSPAEAEFPRTNIVIVNYDILEKLRPEIDKRQWDLRIVDECQYLKDGDAKRTIFTYGGTINKRKIPAINARKRLYLSGTPLVNKPADLWTVIKECDPYDLGANWDYFGKRYCQMWRAPWGMDYSGAAHLSELQDRLRSRFMVRRKKRDVLTWLTPKKRQIVILQPPQTVKKLLSKEKAVYEKVKTKLELTIEAAEAAINAKEQEGDWEGYKKEAKTANGKKFDIDFTELSKLRHEIAVEKVPYCIEYINLMLNEHQKVVVFAHHQDVIEQVKRAFESRIKLAVIVGGMESKARQREIDSFQNDRSCRLVLASITVCIGFELTAASYGLAIELDWRSTVMDQCEDRLDRIGQTDPVVIQHLVFADSTDAKQVQKIIAKQEIIDAALD